MAPSFLASVQYSYICKNCADIEHLSNIRMAEKARESLKSDSHLRPMLEIPRTKHEITNSNRHLFGNRNLVLGFCDLTSGGFSDYNDMYIRNVCSGRTGHHQVSKSCKETV